MIEHVILDLDQTLIHSLDITDKRTSTLKKIFKYHEAFGYVMFERPFLKEFIGALAKQYSISIWTAAGHDYGRYVLENIVEPYMPADKSVQLFFYDKNCASSMELTGILKNLDLLYNMIQHGYPFTRSNTVIVDDNADILAQNSYVIQIEPFNFKKEDNELEVVWRIIQNIK